MRKILLLVILISTGVMADSLQVYSSVFGSYGTYSDGTNSKSGSVFLTTGLNYRHHLTIGYDYLYKDGGIWGYKQQFGTAGVTLNFDPFYAKFSYGHINGKYDDTTGYISYDYLNIYSAEVLLREKSFYFGAGINHMYLNGFEKRNINQVTARVDYYGGYTWYLSVRPVYTMLTTDNSVSSMGSKNKRNLLSVALKFNYLLTPGWVGKLGGSFGKRAYYYDNDLYTIYNQDENQEMMLSAGIDWYATWRTVINISYQYNKFDGYDVNYLIAGVKISW
ncbi:MAG: hypothetical protein LCH52_01495 [Bacteroidetes bacterium]|nr:hypothetical protein [Bacteroidota bacterium]